MRIMTNSIGVMVISRAQKGPSHSEYAAMSEKRTPQTKFHKISSRQRRAGLDRRDTGSSRPFRESSGAAYQKIRL